MPELPTIWSAWVNYNGKVEVVSTTAESMTAKQVRVAQDEPKRAAWRYRLILPKDQVHFTRRDAVNALFAQTERDHAQAARWFEVTGDRMAEIAALLQEES